MYYINEYNVMEYRQKYNNCLIYFITSLCIKILPILYYIYIYVFL